MTWLIKVQIELWKCDMLKAKINDNMDLTHTGDALTQNL